MKLEEISNEDEELEQIIEKLQRDSRGGLDKYKRWEAEQKLKLAQAEQRKRQGVNGLMRNVKRWLGQ